MGIEQQVFYSKPDVFLLKRLGLQCVDMHFHTQFSDGSATIPSLIRAANKKQVGFSITDHNEIAGSIQAIKARPGVMVVPGIEVGSMHGKDILLYFYSARDLESFYDKEVLGFKLKRNKARLGKDFEEILDIARNYNCVLAAAHPFTVLWGSAKQYLNDERILRKIPNIEVINSHMTRDIDMKAFKVAEKHNKGIVGGSDGHILSNLSDAITCSYANNVEEFLDNIQKKRNLVVGTERNPVRSYVTTIPVKRVISIKGRMGRVWGAVKKIRS